MALIKQIRHLSPPNFEVNEQQVDGYKEVVLHLTALFDASVEETDAIKLDLSKYLTKNLVKPIRSAVKWIKYSNQGLTYIKLAWDRAGEEVIAYLPGNSEGVLDWSDVGGLCELSDGADGTTGDIRLTTIGADSGDTYDITMCVQLKDRAPAPLQGN